MRIAGTGEYAPRRVVGSAAFDRRFGKPAGWAERRFGVGRRRVAGADETSSLMGARAARAALDAAALEPAQLDCIVSACSLMEQPIPSLGVQLQARLGLGASGVPAFDVNATCLSFLVALDTLSCAIAAGRYRCALIVSSEIAAAGVDPDDAETAPLFGDGAAAAVLVAPGPGAAGSGAAGPGAAGPGAAGQRDGGDGDAGSALLACRIETYGDGAALCEVRAGGTRERPGDDYAAFRRAARFRMDGRAVYRFAAQRLPGFLQRLLDAAGVGIAELDCVVPHQASGHALDYLQAQLGLPAARISRVIERRGNQVAASLPVALHHAIVSGKLRRGQRVALIGSGAGLSLGGAVLRY